MARMKIFIPILSIIIYSIMAKAQVDFQGNVPLWPITEHG